MTIQEIIEKFQSDEVIGIYGYMYGKPFLNYGHNDQKRDKIIFIEKDLIQRNRIAFIYVWGLPGPDYNYYYFKDYGITWAFSKEEIKEIKEYIPPKYTFEEIHGREQKEFSWDKDLKDIINQRDDWVQLVGIQVGDIVNIDGYKWDVMSINEPTTKNINDGDLVKQHITIMPLRDSLPAERLN